MADSNTRTATWLLAVIAFLIAYGSLYPFRFAGFDGAGPLELLQRLSFARTTRADLAANVLLYLPLGASLAWLASSLIVMTRGLRRWREHALLANEGNAVIRQHLFHATQFGTHDSVGGNHHGLMAIADVITPERPFFGCRRTHHEHRFRECSHDDDELS